MSKKTEEELIKQFDKAHKAYEKAEQEMRLHFNNKVIPKVKSATTLNELKDVKESLRVMPESVSKTLLFRAILMHEDVINGTRCKVCLIEKNKCQCNTSKNKSV